MAQEVERKFLVLGAYKHLATSAVRVVQGFLNTAPERTVRIRLMGEQGYITVKGPSLDGVSRFEWEQLIAKHEAQQLLALCEPGVIDKTRHRVPVGRHTFEVDEFHGDNQGLTVAEVELTSPDEPFERPSWLGPEVTHNPRYLNSMLAKHPFKLWRND